MKSSKLSPTTRWILFLATLIVLTILNVIISSVVEGKLNDNIASLITFLGFIVSLGVLIFLYYYLIIGHDPEGQKIKTGAR
jgi:hypothetical protein